MTVIPALERLHACRAPKDVFKTSEEVYSEVTANHVKIMTMF